MEEVRRRTSLAPLAFSCCLLCLIGVETEGLLDYQGRAGIIFPLHGGTFAQSCSVSKTTFFQGLRKSSNSKESTEVSQEFSEQIGPFIHRINGFSKNSHEKVHPNFAKNLGRQYLGNTFSALNFLQP